MNKIVLKDFTNKKSNQAWTFSENLYQLSRFPQIRFKEPDLFLLAPVSCAWIIGTGGTQGSGQRFYKQANSTQRLLGGNTQQRQAHGKTHTGGNSGAWDTHHGEGLKDMKSDHQRSSFANPCYLTVKF